MLCAHAIRCCFRCAWVALQWSWSTPITTPRAVVVGGLSALGAGLSGMGIPKNGVVEYKTARQPYNFLVMAHGNRLCHDLEAGRVTE